jgi:hypothetical protein
LIGSGLAIAGEGVLAAIWGMRIGNSARRLADRLETERGMIESDIKRLRLAIEETRRLWRPYRRALRWLRHPLVVALLQSYARRRAAAR